MKIAIVNDIHVGKGLEHNGKLRASSHLIEEMLKNFLEKIVLQHSPDLLINLGDLIRSEEKEADEKKYRLLISNFEQLRLPIIHLLGNHELRRMPLGDIENVWSDFGFDQKSYGYKDIGNFTLLWLGLELNSKDHRIRYLPSNQLKWLKDRLEQIRHPTVIFTHCAIDDHDVRGNFFYEACDNQDKSPLFLENQDEIRKTISASKHVIAVLQAHLHYFHTKKIDNIPYITCPAMGDNICGPNVKENVPEIYTILSLENGRLVAKAFSGKYCFAGYEGD
jgi:3',5'-cyclic-AMP phosphodiesterase